MQYEQLPHVPSAIPSLPRWVVLLTCKPNRNFPYQVVWARNFATATANATNMIPFSTTTSHSFSCNIVMLCLTQFSCIDSWLFIYLFWYFWPLLLRFKLLRWDSTFHSFFTLKVEWLAYDNGLMDTHRYEKKLSPGLWLVGRVITHRDQAQSPGFNPEHTINQTWWCVPVIPVLKK